MVTTKAVKPLCKMLPLLFPDLCIFFVGLETKQEIPKKSNNILPVMCKMNCYAVLDKGFMIKLIPKPTMRA